MARERVYLQTILNRVYGEVMARCPFIRCTIQHMVFQVINECEVHNGAGELSESVGRAVSDFATPLREEHKEFLTKALIPLHKVKALSTFHQELSYCMAQFVEKGPRLASEVVTSMLEL